MPRRLIRHSLSLLLPLALVAGALLAFAAGPGILPEPVIAAGELPRHDKEDKDSLVMLLSAKSAQLIEERGEHFRKVFGPARFLHNGTYLICDTALWNLDRNIINAFGHVKILQDETVLSSDRLDYLIDEDLAQFRGSLVQLTDKEGNLLRTRHLDFNTKDSVAVFQNGGAMKDKDGQIIESREGTYDARIKVFTFLSDVNMFTDSLFVSTTELIYESPRSLATFPSPMSAWKDDKMLSADCGWHDRSRDLFFFERHVHALSPTQEAWADTLWFDRTMMTVDMYGNAQVADSVRNVTGLAGHISYVDSTALLTLTIDPMMEAVSDGEKPDTVWIGGDRLVYYTVPMCAVDSLFKVVSATRLSEINTDAVTEYRRKAAEAAEKARKEAEEAKAKAEGRPVPGAGGPGAAPGGPGRPGTGGGPASSDGASSASARDASSASARDASSVISSEVEKSVPPGDSTSFHGLPVESPDSLAVPPADTLPPPDSTRIGFFQGKGNVRIYRHDFQVVCDSLAYSDYDSLARLYVRPVVWNEENRQFTADSISALIRHGGLDRASLMSSAFVAIEEDSLLFDQIRGTEMMAFFDSTGAMTRFDALGGANALFYLEENASLATVNVVEAKMLSTAFRDGNLERILYFEGIKNDAYPVVQLPRESRYLKGFEWRGKDRPMGPRDISSRTVRPSERERYESFPHASFRQTDIYFKGYMAGVHRQMAENERKRAERRAEQRRQRELAAAAAAMPDTLTLIAPDSTSFHGLSVESPDSTSVIPSDTTHVIPSVVEESITTDSFVAPAPQNDSTVVALPDTTSTHGADSTSFHGLSVESPDSTSVIPSDPTHVIPSVVEESLLPDPKQAARDSLRAIRDSVRAAHKAAREAKRAERARRKAERIAAREARWAELDRRDSIKAAEKALRRLERIRRSNRRTLDKIREDSEREQRLLERYKEMYRRRKARQEARRK